MTKFSNVLPIDGQWRRRVGLAPRIYDFLGPTMQARLDRARYAFNLLPRVNPHAKDKMKLPSPYRACLVISADLELAWAWRYVRDVSDPEALALQKANQTRENISALLELFDRHAVPVTWATVGHLFLEKCPSRNSEPHPELYRLPYFEDDHWEYTSGKWFDADPCSDYRQAPAWYAPDLLRTILSARTKHEIACHTFSHIDCSDVVCPPEVMNSELAECQRLAAEWGLRLTSFVFPGNLPGNLGSLSRFGFKAYRSHGRYQLDIPRQDDLGLWQIPGGLCWEMPAKWSAKDWIGVLYRSVDRAIETQTLLHLWFHPSCDPANVEEIFPAVLDYVSLRRKDLWITTIEGLASIDMFNS